MGIMSVASRASKRKGYNYYTEKKVLSFRQTSEHEYEGQVAGTAEKPYHVHINVAHVRQSHCNCPYAKDTRIVCKHMIAVFFTAFPDMADEYIAEVRAYEAEQEHMRQEWERLRQRHYKEIEQYVKSLSKKELQEALCDVILELEEYRQW